MRLILLAFALWFGASTAALAWENMAPDTIAGLNRQLSTEHSGVRSLAIQRQGKLIYEFYREGLNPATLHDTGFATASVVSTLVGIAIQQGQIKSTEQPLSEFLPSASDPAVDPRVRAITIGQLLSLTAGFDPSVKQVGRWAFPLDFALKRALVAPPGTVFSFNPGTAHLAARVLTRATKQRMSDYARNNLFTPLDIRRFLWRLDGPGGSELGYEGLELTTRDMAKIGQLYLQKGMWNDKTLLPSTYVDLATTKQAAGGAPLNWKFGYFWWTAPDESSRIFMAGADDGQRIYVNPALELVIVITSDKQRARGGRQRDVDALIRSLVTGAIKTEAPTPPNRRPGAVNGQS